LEIVIVVSVCIAIIPDSLQLLKVRFNTAIIMAGMGIALLVREWLAHSKYDG